MLRASKFVICICFLSVLGSGTVVASKRNDTRSGLQRQRRQTNCDDGFRCLTSRECIREDKYCDGKADCIDGSDETDRCKRLRCPGYLFRCKYGGCINKKKNCDGKKDCIDGSDEENCPSLSSKCNDTQFECKSGQCINEENKCDGTPDCADKSDETLETCSRLNCPGYTFKCKYGACISIKGLCNGISDCFDGSDEDPTMCTPSVTSVKPPVTPPVTPFVPITPPKTGNRPPPVNTPDSCVLPAQIQMGSWSIWGATYDYAPGDRVVSGTLLEVKCRTGYKVDGVTSVLICKGREWNNKVPGCIQICDPLVSTATTFVNCSYRGREVSCSEAISGTNAKFSCPRFYELSTTSHIRFCLDGTWDEMKPTCMPVCGQKNVNIKELIIGGKVVKRGTYPWTIALYQNKSTYDHICGGTLINKRVVVTAAHCVSDKLGNKYNENLYLIGAGKFYRAYDDPRDTDAEFSQVEKIFVYERYKGSTYDYEGDIAVIVTKEAFNSTQTIQAVCIDWDQNSFYESHLLGRNGTVTGWGYTARGKNASPELKEIDLPYVDYSKCYDAMPEGYKKYVRSDKMCAGYLDEGIGVCEGDSGGGLVFERVENKRYYLRGVVSVAPQVAGSCDENEYAIYTKISSYIDFIAQIERTYRT